MIIKNKSIAIYVVPAFILAIPLIAMKFTREVNWSGFDFLIAGILLFTSAFSIHIILKKVTVNYKRFIYIAIVLIILFLIWAELAVGIFGSSFAGN